MFGTVRQERHVGRGTTGEEQCTWGRKRKLGGRLTGGIQPSGVLKSTFADAGEGATHRGRTLGGPWFIDGSPYIARAQPGLIAQLRGLG